ncbi:MAG: glucosyl-3-phosphoglycerate synthase [Actinomycetota bacterium]|jgi:glucosyl-3-phosphoglycerate synthase|nr:glucosyl-3-phosphoglycerate synthase [Actinomycetota bacterium]
MTAVLAPAAAADWRAEAKAALGLAVSVCVPARNEAVTIARVVAAVLADGLVDEVVVVDDGSSDGTGALAAALGARVVHRSGPPGKGRAMAEGILATGGDIVVFLDADVRNFDGRFVRGLLEPLLADPAVMLVKATYRRPKDGVADEGGRVTELLARPVLERFFPELDFVRQPLAGEVAIRREALEGLVLEPGYGVEVGMLIDVCRRFGPAAIAQADLGTREHRNRPLADLSAQARQVLDACLSRTAVPIRFGGRAVRNP